MAGKETPNDSDHRGRTTPGRPRDSASRQQTQASQTTQTGSRELDQNSTSERQRPPTPNKPAGAK